MGIHCVHPFDVISFLAINRRGTLVESSKLPFKDLKTRHCNREDSCVNEFPSPYFFKALVKGSQSLGESRKQGWQCRGRDGECRQLPFLGNDRSANVLCCY